MGKKRSTNPDAEASHSPPGLPGKIPVPVEAARAIAETYRKSAVVICAADRVDRTLHFATYGVEAADKVWAAGVGDRMGEEMGRGMEVEMHEDFRADPRATDAGLVREALELLTAIIDQKVMLPSDVRQRVLRVVTRSRS
jgi:hypothetical protein